MEASTLRPAATLPKPRITVGAPLLRLRSDEQLVALFRAGHDEAFRAIHDRYHRRLFAYARQMLPGRQDAEDVLQDVFVRAYAGLRASDRDLALRAWLFRVAHNRCVDQLRKPATPPPEVLWLVHVPSHDPPAELDLRESLRRLVDDIRRLPDQQRSALLMRELAGMSYADLASSLGISVGAVKSLLVRARLALAQASEARDTACAVIREQLVEAHDRGVRPNANARRHVRDCSCCKSFRHELRGVTRELAAVAPAVGPLGAVAKLLGFFSGGGGAASGGGALVTGGTTASAGGLALSTGHVATLIVAAVATAGGAVELQRTILPVAHHAAKVQSITAKHADTPATAGPTTAVSSVQAGSYRPPAFGVVAPPAATSKPATPPAISIKRHKRPKADVSGADSMQSSSSTVSASTPGEASSTCTTAPVTTAGSGSSSSAASSTTDGSSTSSSTSSTTGSTVGSPATGSSSAASPAPSSTCGSSTGSSTSTSTSSPTSTSTSSTSGGGGSSGGQTSSAASGGTTTDAGSSGGGAAGSSGGVGSSGSSSNTTTE